MLALKARLYYACLASINMREVPLMADEQQALGDYAAQGGKARAKSLTSNQRKAIARAAAQARWVRAGKEPLPRATHKGSFKEEFGINVDCYVLNDAAKTAVISQRGMGQALGLSKRGDRLTVFAGSKTMDEYIGRDLREKLANPLVFQRKGAAAENPVGDRAHGYDATILIDLCNAIIAARRNGKLGAKRYDRMAAQAQIVLSASGKAGIKGLVYALAGYNPTAQEVIDAFKAYVQEEAREWEKEFPDQLYKEWYRLYELPKPERNRPWKFKHLTVDQVYRPLAKSNGQIFKLTKAQRQNSNARYKKLHQFLSEIGVKALRTHLGELLGIARISNDKHQYEAFFDRLFGAQYNLFDQGEHQ
jgi:P63C domain